MFDEHKLRESTASRFGVLLPPKLVGAVAKRRAEYIAGRFCAANATRAIFSEYAGSIQTTAAGLPAWAGGTVGSITHTRSFASAAVGRSSVARSVGIDSEVVLCEDGVDAVFRQVASADEARLHARRLSDAAYATLLFSAKESVFKCLYPIVKRMFYFEHARLVALDTDERVFRIELAADLDAEFRVGFPLEGRYDFDGTYVHTGLFLEHKRQRRAGR